MTHTRTHVFVPFANPYLRCERCRRWVTSWHDDGRCGCDSGWWNEPCGCVSAGVTSACPSWNPVDGCVCRLYLGRIDHGEPPAREVDR